MSHVRRRLALIMIVVAGLLATAFSTSASAATAPVVTDAGGGSGPLAPTVILIRGQHLTRASAVRFGSHPGVVVRQVSSSAIQVRTPRMTKAGTVSVQVRTADGWSRSGAQTRYTFVAVPVVKQVSPSSGVFSGGDRVTLTGTNLSTVTKVLVGPEPAKILSRTAGTVVVSTPAGLVGRTSIRVFTPGGTAKNPFSFSVAAPASALALTEAPGTATATNINWVTGGLDVDTGTAQPWVVSLPKGAAVPTVGQSFVVRPGTAAFPTGLAGTVTSVADQLDESVQVTVASASLETSLSSLRLDYSGSVEEPAAAARSAKAVEAGRAAQFSISGPTAIGCKSKDGKSVSFGADISMSVTDVDVDQHVNLGSLVRRPTYDAAFTGEVRTTGKISVEAAAECQIKTIWRDLNGKVIPLGTTGATIGFAPVLSFKVTGKGTWSIDDRTRTTFAVDAQLGKTPRYSRTARTVESKQGGSGSFEAEVTAGVQVQFGLLDRAGLQGKVLVGVNATLEGADRNVCIDSELFSRISVGVFLDVLVARWEADAFSVKFSLGIFHKCLVSDSPINRTEPEITSARLPGATIGQPYTTTLATRDGRNGSWSVVLGPVPAGITLTSGNGQLAGTPQGPVADYPIIVDFKDSDGQVATTTVWIMVGPGESLGGGDLQATLRWTSAADLDLHVVDPSGEEISYSHKHSDSGGTLDHDANAGCSRTDDDDNHVENVFWPAGGAPKGDYRIRVVVYDACAAAVDWHLTVRRNGAIVVDQDGSGDSADYPATLG